MVSCLATGEDSEGLPRPDHGAATGPWKEVWEVGQEGSSHRLGISAGSVMICSGWGGGVASALSKGGEDGFKGGALQGSCPCK